MRSSRGTSPQWEVEVGYKVEAILMGAESVTVSHNSVHRLTFLVFVLAP